jgi:crotonobetainyl-CoA:carnitine CoA-transferase CaiB-like acyl-CoA transferase
MLDAVESVLGPDILLWDSAYVIKEPGNRRFVSWHQDLTYWGLGETDHELTAWIALSPATAASGCMRFVAGSHGQAILPHRDTFAADNMLSRGQEIAVEVDEADAVEVLLQPGQMSFHHGRMFHASGPNRSADRRIGMAIRYVTPEVRQLVGARDYAMPARGAEQAANWVAVAPPDRAFDAAALALYEQVLADQSTALTEGAEQAVGLYRPGPAPHEAISPMADLDGIFVVSVEQAVAAPYASGRLADAGARVVKVERPEGDFARRYDADVKGASAYFVWLNRGKESIRLDLKDAADSALLARMVARADVFIQNLAPGAAGRLGFGAEALRARHPRLITCAISGYGEAGPYRDQKAYDLLIQAESGLASVNGTAEAPARVGVSVCDIAAGMTAQQAILQALYARERTGAGRAIEVSLYHAMADWMNVPYLQRVYGGRTPGRHGLRHPTIAPYGAYACADGKALLISVQNEREWHQLCAEVLARPELAADPRFESNAARVANRPELERLIGAAFAERDREANIARLEAARVAYGRLSDLDDLAGHPQNRYIRVATENGPVRLLAPGAVVAGTAPGFGPVPALGAHDATLRREFGDGDEA